MIVLREWGHVRVHRFRLQCSCGYRIPSQTNCTKGERETVPHASMFTCYLFCCIARETRRMSDENYRDLVSSALVDDNGSSGWYKYMILADLVMFVTDINTYLCSCGYLY